MIYQSGTMEEQAILQTAARMCAAARTAPKTKGKDYIRTFVLTGQEKDALADKMDEIGLREFGEDARVWFGRDAKNVRSAQAVVLIGIDRVYRGTPRCSYCGFQGCAACKSAGASCAFAYIDLGIALASAAETAMADKLDNRIMYSIGIAAAEMSYTDNEVLWHGIPISISGKNIFFDRVV